MLIIICDHPGKQLIRQGVDLDPERVEKALSGNEPAPHGALAPELAAIENIRFFRALDSMIAGLILLIFLLSLKRMMDVLPIPYIQYFYIIPVYLVFYGAISLPATGFKLFLYGKACARLKWSAFMVLLLSPFLHWWLEDPESTYLLVNFIGLCIAAAIFIVSLSNLVYAVSKEDNLVLISGMSRLARFSSLYLMLAPVLAFFVTVIFGKSSGQDIFMFVVKIERWELLVFFFPVILSLGMLMQLRYAKYRKLK